MYRKIESENDVDTLVPIAHEIWSDHFKTMFDSEALPRLIEGSQSKKAILSQIEDGYQYFFISQDDRKIGYFAYKIDHSKNELFLSKIYVYSDQRGKGVGRKVLNHLEKLSHDVGVGKIVLTVNHRNTNSIKAYEKWGFANLGRINRQFENGLVLEDIRMEKSL
ncbi:MAG: GNAT family N-acetyltransferase [Deltaproteobacteria bacterium]|nr:GNAT family N-acetyltransferase [Deltaproteobacteria bacterium]